MKIKIKMFSFYFIIMKRTYFRKVNGSYCIKKKILQVNFVLF